MSLDIVSQGICRQALALSIWAVLMIDKQKATITFERPSAARTALLLQDAHLGTSQVHVSATGPLDGASTPPGTAEKSKTDTHAEFSQEDKPRTAIVAGTPSSPIKLSLPLFSSLLEISLFTSLHSFLISLFRLFKANFKAY